MKLVIIFLFWILATSARVHGQDSAALCPFLKEPQFRVFIPGSKDSIQSNGIKIRVVEYKSLVNGFELVSDDSLVKVKSFCLSFFNSSGDLSSKCSENSWITDDTPDIVPLPKIGNALYVTLDRIRVEYKGFCYRVSGQVYYDQ